MRTTRLADEAITPLSQPAQEQNDGAIEAKLEGERNLKDETQSGRECVRLVKAPSGVERNQEKTRNGAAILEKPTGVESKLKFAAGCLGRRSAGRDRAERASVGHYDHEY